MRIAQLLLLRDGNDDDYDDADADHTRTGTHTHTHSLTDTLCTHSRSHAHSHAHAHAHSNALAHAHAQPAPSPALAALPTPVSAPLRPTHAPPPLLPPLPPSFHLPLPPSARHASPSSVRRLLKLADSALQDNPAAAPPGGPDARLTFSRMVQLASAAPVLHPPQYQAHPPEPEEASATSSRSDAEKKRRRMHRSDSDESFSLSPKQSFSKDPSSAGDVSDSRKSSRNYPCPYYGQPKPIKRIKSAFNSPRSFPINNPYQDNTEKEFLCFAKFRRRQEMDRHVLSVHCSEEEKAWKCPATCHGRPCERRYARADALRKHLDSAKSRNVPGGCSFGLTNEEIVAMVKSGFSLLSKSE
ncbi:hypothetical protein HDU83_003520 [Entophlyctis luteolus]|nr:hypothetical protein HDU83_003520 [Entophlyctis luteolus]